MKQPNEISMKAIKDGDSWAFVLFDFQNLQVSEAVFVNEFVLNDVMNEAYRMLMESGIEKSKRLFGG